MTAPDDHWLPQDDVLGRLPEPFEEEPESLRQDIADELQDHLLSSLGQELQRTPEEKQAKQNVLNRFGDVRKIARQLWFDWMKGKIMTQRITLATTLFMTIACFGICFIGWNMMKQNQEFNNAMLEKLSVIAETSNNPPIVEDKEYTGVSIKLVTETSGGPPATGYRYELTGNFYDRQGTSGATDQISGECDESGIVDFGEILPGSYTLVLRTPWNEFAHHSLFVPRGKAFNKEFVCPKQPPSYSKADITIKLPEDLRKEEIWIMCSFESKPKHQIENWSSENEKRHYTTIHNTQGVIVDSPTSSELSWTGKDALNGKFIYSSYGSSFKPRLTPPSYIESAEYSPALRPDFPALITEIKRIVGKHQLAG